MATKDTDYLGEILPDAQYPLRLLERRAGVGRTTIREARSKGLRVTYAGGRGFVRGRDWIEFVENHGRASAHGQ